MTIRIGWLSQVERDPRDLSGTAPIEAYWIDKAGSPGTYVLASGRKSNEATLFWKDSGSNVFLPDDDLAEEDRTSFLIDATRVIY